MPKAETTSKLETRWVTVEEMAAARGVKKAHHISVELYRQRKRAEKLGVEWPERGIPKPDMQRPVLAWDRARDDVRRYMSGVT